jgi:hypothetical protein
MYRRMVPVLFAVSFLFAQPSVTLLSPNGGEEYWLDDTLHVRWSSPDTVGGVCRSPADY